MASGLSGFWSGFILGTNRGKVLMRLSVVEKKLTGEVILRDAEYGPTICEMRGILEDRKAVLRLKNFNASAPIMPIDGKIELQFSDDFKNAEGIWGTDIGTHGLALIEQEKIPKLLWMWEKEKAKQLIYLRRIYALFLLTVILIDIATQWNITSIHWFIFFTAIGIHFSASNYKFAK